MYGTNTFYFISGAIMLGLFVGGLYFLRFWQRSGDRLFLFFAAAFFVLSFQRIASFAVDDVDERTVALMYLLRFAGFALIVLGVIDKNRSASPSSQEAQDAPAPPVSPVSR
jgi:hypothetical protein